MSDREESREELLVELERLREIERRFQRMGEMISDYAYSFAMEEDLSMQGEWLSESFTRVFGYTLDEVKQLGGWQVLIHPDDRETAAEHVRRVLANKSDVCEMRMVTRDGEPRWLRSYAIPIFDESLGRVVRIWGVPQDIDEVVKKQAELKQSQKFLESVLSSIQDGISVLDRNMNILHVNEVMRRWYRDTLPLEGKKCYQAYHGRNQPCSPCPSRRCLQTGKTERDIVPGLPGSEAEWLELFSYPHRDENGRIDMVVEFVRDITRQRSLERQLVEAQKMEAIGRLAGGVAHDFNNLLSVIIGRCDMLLDKLPQGGQERAEVKEILAAGQRAETLTRQLLAFSRRQVLEPAVLDINQVVEELQKLLQRLIGEDIELTFIPAPGLGRTYLDRGQFEQVLMNLVVNSRDAMPRGGKLTIETENVELDQEYAARHNEVEPGSYVMLSVSDDGTGMDEKTRERIFEPFFTTKEMGRGTGLGLSTVYGIVKQSGGHIWVYSEPGRGTTFKIYFKRTDRPVPIPARTVPRASRGSGQDILVVEDNRAVREFLEKALSSLGYRPLAAPNGERARELAAAHSGDIALLITDVVLTGMDGRQLAEKLQAERPGLKVLYISGYTTNAIVQHGVLEEGLNFLAKPFTLDALAAKIGQIMKD